MASLVAQTVKRLPTMWETRVQCLGQEVPLEKEMATHSSILAWKIPWTEEPGRLQSMGWQRVGHNWATSLRFTYHMPEFVLRFLHLLSHLTWQQLCVAHTFIIPLLKIRQLPALSPPTLPVACQASHDVCCSDGEGERRWGLLPEEQSVLGYCHHPFFWLLYVDGLLAWEYSLSEPGTPGPFTQYSLNHHHTLVHGWCWLAWMILVGVSLYAIVLHKSKVITNTWTQLLWFLQTFLFGMASLYYLIAFRPKCQKQT